ncbi:extracellular solute-binding protein [Streptomyces capparidis]
MRQPPPPPRGRPSRRSVVGGTLALATGLAGLGATGCAAPDSVGGAGTRVRYWNLFGGGDGANMQRMLDDFRAAHPGIDLEDATLEWGAPYYTKLAMAGAGGRAPEVAVLHLARLPGFAPGRLLDPFDLDLLAEFGVRPADFPPDIWERGRVGGETYAVPFDTHPLVLYYNTDICRRAGLLGPGGRLKDISGPEGFRAALEAAKEATGEPGLVFETLGVGTVGPWRLFSTFYAQTGGTVLDDEGTTITLDDDAAVEVLTFLRGLTRDGLAVAKADYQGTVATFHGGKTGFALNGDWEVTTYVNAKLPFSMTQVPAVFGGRRTAQADCHAFVLPHRRDRGGEANRAAHRFVAWMLRNSVDWAAGGHVPAYRPVLDDPAYLRMRPQSEYRSAIDHVALDPRAWFAGSASVMWLDLARAFSGALTGSRTPRQAVAQARASLRKLIATPNPLGGSTPV